jgi:hypothetical protein
MSQHEQRKTESEVAANDVSLPFVRAISNISAIVGESCHFDRNQPVWSLDSKKDGSDDIWQTDYPILLEYDEDEKKWICYIFIHSVVSSFRPLMFAVIGYCAYNEIAFDTDLHAWQDNNQELFY